MIQLLGPIANIASTWLEGRQEKAKAKQHRTWLTTLTIIERLAVLRQRLTIPEDCITKTYKFVYSVSNECCYTCMEPG